MKNLYLTSGQNIAVDPETNEVNRLDGVYRYSIDKIYYITEPMHVVYGWKGVNEEIDVEPNDILIQFDGRDSNKNRLAVVKSDKWVENIKAMIEEEQAEKERWANEKSCGACPNCNESKN